MQEESREMIICPHCKGVGLDYKRDKNGGVWMHRGKPITEPCQSCDGQGKLIKVTYVEYYLVPPNGIIEYVEEPKQRKGGFLGGVFKKN